MEIMEKLKVKTSMETDEAAMYLDKISFKNNLMALVEA